MPDPTAPRVERGPHQVMVYIDSTGYVLIEPHKYGERLEEIRRLTQRIAAAEAENANLRGAMAAQDERERLAGEKCGVPYEQHGCDWPDAARDRIAALEAERDAARIQTAEVCRELGVAHDKQVAALKAERDAAVQRAEQAGAALTDMLAGWRYIRTHYGALSGVGWDRCEASACAALAEEVKS